MVRCRRGLALRQYTLLKVALGAEALRESLQIVRLSINSCTLF